MEHIQVTTILVLASRSAYDATYDTILNTGRLQSAVMAHRRDCGFFNNTAYWLRFRLHGDVDLPTGCTTVAAGMRLLHHNWPIPSRIVPSDPGATTFTVVR